MEQIIENQTHAPVSNQIKKVICGFVNSNFEVFKEWKLLDVKMFRDIFTSEISKHTKTKIDEDFKDGGTLAILKNVVKNMTAADNTKILVVV